jgi:uncharacterized lipoprotein YehR (DUF1307 family)
METIKRIVDIYKNLDWIQDKIDELSEKINDYIFLSGCDIKLTKPNVKKLKEFNRECDELKARHDLEMKELKKLLDSQDE